MILEIYMLYGKSYKSKVTEYSCIFSHFIYNPGALVSQPNTNIVLVQYYIDQWFFSTCTLSVLSYTLHGYAIDLWPNLQEIIAVIFLLIQYHFILLSCYLPSLAKLWHFHATDFSIQTRFPHVSQNTQPMLKYTVSRATLSYMSH